MAVIHETTMKPGKLDLLAAWLPAQPWYLGAGRREPRLSRAGGFRLDDPAGEVGIEFMVVADSAAGDIVYYLVPMTYRGYPLAGAGAGAGTDSGTVTVAGTGAGIVTVAGADASTGTDAEDGLIGTAEHGVLGRRWIYDGAHDPVLVAQLVACVQGAAEPQAQSVSETPDPTVTVAPLAAGRLTAAGSAVAANGPSGTDVRVGTDLRVDTAGAAAPAGQLVLRVNRILTPQGGQEGRPCLSAPWRLPDGTQTRGVFVSALDR